MKQSTTRIKSSCKLWNNHTVILFLFSLLINGIFLYVYRKNIYCNGPLRQHGEVAYNVYRYNSTKINPNRLGALCCLEVKNKQRADYYEIDHEQYGPPTQYRSHSETVGYGVLLGLLWKLTHSLNFFDIQLLQLLLFSFLLLLFYQIALMLFNQRTALFSCIALLLFFPAIYLNVQAMRGIWPYYSAVILLYVSLSYLQKQVSIIVPIIGGVAIALCQFMRTPMFLHVVTTAVVLFGYALTTKELRSVFKLLLVLFITNLLFFWAPFAAYNKMAYNRYLVSSSGLNFIQGLGEFENPWGYHLCDGWYLNFMKKNYPGLTPLEWDDKSKDLFFKAIKENPVFYIKNLLLKMPRLILPGLPWFNYQDTKRIYWMYVHGTPLREIFSIITRKPIIFWDFLARHLYIGLFLLLAYLGILLMLIRKKFFAFSLIFFGIIIVGYSVIFAHIDHRYLVPYYAFFALFVGYLFAQIPMVPSKKS